MNWKAVFKNGIKGTLLLLVAFAAFPFVGMILNFIYSSFILRTLFNIITIGTITYFFFRKMPKMNGYSENPEDYDLEHGAATLLAMILFPVLIFLLKEVLKFYGVLYIYI